ncbi:MAG: lipid A-modifier LpxR family protein [Usitatibacter sp.]
MDRAVLSRAAGAALLAASGTCLADGAAHWYLQVDNDVVFGTDRWYTSGVRIAREANGVEIGLLQEIYTPEGDHWHRGVSDRAPVGRLLASVAKHDVSATAYQTLEVMAGVRGPSAVGRQSTQAIHQVIPAPRVDWTRQLDDEFDGALVATRTQAVGRGGFHVHVGAQLGNQVTFAHAGAEWRWGTGASRLLRFAATPDPATTPGWSAFVGASVRGVARNELLSRNYDPELPPPDRRNGVARVGAGVAWRGAWGALTFELAQDSREFAQQRTPHAFGSLALQATF